MIVQTNRGQMEKNPNQIPRSIRYCLQGIPLPVLEQLLFLLQIYSQHLIWA